MAASPSTAAATRPNSPTTGDEESEDRPKMLCMMKKATFFKLSIVVLLLVGIVLGLTVGDLDSRIGDVLAWLEDNRVKGIAIYVAIYTGLTGMCLRIPCLRAAKLYLAVMLDVGI